MQVEEHRDAQVQCDVSLRIEWIRATSWKSNLLSLFDGITWKGMLEVTHRISSDLPFRHHETQESSPTVATLPRLFFVWKCHSRPWIEPQLATSFSMQRQERVGRRKDASRTRKDPSLSILPFRNPLGFVSCTCTRWYRTFRFVRREARVRPSFRRFFLSFAWTIPREGARGTKRSQTKRAILSTSLFRASACVRCKKVFFRDV